MVDIDDRLYEYLTQNFTKAALVEIMCDALDLMQQYNGRSMTYCIVSSIPGASVRENDDGTYSYGLPIPRAKRG